MTPHPSKDGREPLTRQKILDKAIEILDAEGLEALSMRRLAKELGVEAMALYHHFPNKDAILDGVVERIVAETGGQGLPLESAQTDWKAAMRSGPAAAQRVLAVHPKAGGLFLGRQYNTSESLAMLEAPLAILETAGFRGQDLVDAAHAIFAYIVGWYILASGEGGSWSGPAKDAISAAVEAAPLAAKFAPELRDWSHGMDEGLAALLDGLEARLRAKK